MGDGSWYTLTEAEGVSSDKVRPISKRVIEGVEEEGRGRGEEVLDVLLERIDGLARWIVCNLRHLQRGEWLLRH
ncbi:hypothetical protein CRG98_024269, partial [Punica granatum]